MSVYIRSTIKAPHDCGECFLESEGGCCLAVNEYKVTQYYSDTRTKPEWCPLVPVPPHGRLIDADALKMDLTRFYDGEVVAKRLIDEQPTIIPADPPVMEYPQIPGITPTVIAEEGEG